MPVPSLYPCIVVSLTNGHIGSSSLVLCWEVVPISEGVPAIKPHPSIPTLRDVVYRRSIQWFLHSESTQDGAKWTKWKTSGPSRCHLVTNCRNLTFSCSFMQSLGGYFVQLTAVWGCALCLLFRVERYILVCLLYGGCMHLGLWGSTVFLDTHKVLRIMKALKCKTLGTLISYTGGIFCIVPVQQQ